MAFGRSTGVTFSIPFKEDMETNKKNKLDPLKIRLF